MASLWIIDGFNFIRQSRRFAEREARDPEPGKIAALRWLARFAEQTGERVCVVLDAYSGLHRNPIFEELGGIQIIHSRGAYTADEEILAMVQERGQAAIVISSDKAVLKGALQAGASILESQEFEREVGRILEREGEEELPRLGHGKGQAFRPPKEKKKALALLRKYQ